MHTHQHLETQKSTQALTLAITVTASILVLEVIGSYWTKSLALYSDAAHVLLDLLSFILSFTALKMSQKPTTTTRTFGWHRLEVLAALLNGLTICALAFSVTYEALQRISNPVKILGMEMIVIATVGLIGNMIVVLKLRPHVGEDVNVKSAFLHAFGDLFASIAVVISGIWVHLTGQYIVDTLAAIGVACILFFGAGRVFRDSLQILLEGFPSRLNHDLLKQEIESCAGKNTIQDLHVWSLCSHITILTLHLSLDNDQMKSQSEILKKLQSNLAKKFNIMHSTIQIKSKQWNDE